MVDSGEATEQGAREDGGEFERERNGDDVHLIRVTSPGKSAIITP